MPSKAVEINESVCMNCGAEVPPERTGSDYCKDECELEYLRQEVLEKEQRLQRLSRKKGPPKCLGRVGWLTCFQEWYLKDSYDAKRRANQLRKEGYQVAAATIGEMPVRRDGQVELVKVTILTAWREQSDGTYPPAPEFIDGLRTTNGDR
jgi:hypothetical protein